MRHQSFYLRCIFCNRGAGDNVYNHISKQTYVKTKISWKKASKSVIKAFIQNWYFEAAELGTISDSFLFTILTHICPNTHMSKQTYVQTDICPNRHMSKPIYVKTDICTNRHMSKQTYWIHNTIILPTRNQLSQLENKANPLSKLLLKFDILKQRSSVPFRMVFVVFNTNPHMYKQTYVQTDICPNRHMSKQTYRI